MTTKDSQLRPGLLASSRLATAVKDWVDWDNSVSRANTTNLGKWESRGVRVQTSYTTTTTTWQAHPTTDREMNRGDGSATAELWGRFSEVGSSEESPVSLLRFMSSCAYKILV